MKPILSLCLMIVIFANFSCTKECETPRQPETKTYSMFGIWTGTYVTDQVNHTPQNVTFTIYPDGVMLVKVKGNPPAPENIFEAGSWTSSGKTITYSVTTINYTSVVSQQGSFTFSDSTLTGGKWKNSPDNGVSYTGTFSTLTKIN